MSTIEINQLKIEVADRVLVEIPHLLVSKKARIGIIGQNGLGKTTLMEVIAGAKEATSGSVTTQGKLCVHQTTFHGYEYEKWRRKNKKSNSTCDAPKSKCSPSR